MSTGHGTVIALLGALLAGDAATVLAAEVPEVRRLFPWQADVLVERDGLSRLVLSTEVLAACRPDLSDLRLFDREDREVAFLVDRGAEPGSTVEVAQEFVPPVLDVERTQVERDDAPALWRESIDLGLPDAEPHSGNWVLVLEGARSEFVARVAVVGLDEADRNETLVDSSSLFRLRGPRAAEKLRLPLPPFSGKRIRVMLEHEHAGWLNASFRLESARLLERSARIAVPLEATSVRRRDGLTIVELDRPAGVVPDLLRIETTTGTFDRKLRVWDEGTGRSADALGAGNVFRVDSGVPVGALELELRPARGAKLRVEIEDGDSPALEDLTFAAEIRQPSLVFSLPAAESGGPAGVLRFGGGRAHRPRYDLAGLLPRGRQTSGLRAEAAARLFDPEVIGIARLGSSGPNPTYDRTPALAFAMRAGAAIDRGSYRRLRRLRVTDAPEGLSRLRLAAADLALLNEDFTDVRVADDESRQWPYLVERDAATELVPLRVDGPRRVKSESRYELVAPVERIRPQKLVLDTDAPFFDRPFRLVGRLGDGESQPLAGGRLVRPVGDLRPVHMDVSAVRVDSLELFVEDGDDAPLAFDAIHAAVELPDLYLTAPAGVYALLLGSADEHAPRYELERVRDVVLAAKAVPVDAGRLQDNPDYSIGSRLKGKGLGQRALLWTVLIAAVLLLAALTLRLARR